MNTHAVAEKTTGQKVEWLRVIIGDQHFGLDASKVEEILSKFTLTHVPQSDDFILGVFNLRGFIVTTLDSKVILKIPQASKHDQKEGMPDEVLNEEKTSGLLTNKTDDDEPSNLGIVFQYNHDRYCLLIDEVADVISINSNEIEQNTSVIDKNWQEFSDGVWQSEENLIIGMNLQKIAETLIDNQKKNREEK